MLTYLRLEGLEVVVDMHHGSDVANLQTFLGHWRCQDDSVVLGDHAEVSLLARIFRHQARRFKAPIDDPTVRTIRMWPLSVCDDTGPSTTCFSPWGDAALSTTSTVWASNCNMFTKKSSPAFPPEGWGPID